MGGHILVVGAVSGELAGLAEGLESRTRSEIGGRVLLAGHLAGVPIRLIITGPGMANAVQAVTAAVERARPRAIVLTGCAGAFRPSGLEIGDIGVASGEIDAALGLEPETPGDLPEELPFPVMRCGGLEITGRYPVDTEMSGHAVAVLRHRLGRQGMGVRQGPFVTVSAITTTDRRAAALHARFSPCMEAMEGAGVAHVALHYGIPFLEIRAASNFAGKRDRSAWNLPLAFERCALAVRTLIREMPRICGSRNKRCGNRPPIL
ncbi:futalosine hydrolase [Desulfonema ishimotonii]|uniref:Futalosine hydrolase n=1 Tax=Desulfonema ishimotonii TaxID=45657 RepID=A0A401G288_9BACT|nr:futalosine hydrolase [Desulfonema ishimotonii]GBC63315.1 futalosine hydrolase [Desulfonema ishimotonii]